LGAFQLREWVENVAFPKEMEKIMVLVEQGLKEGGIGMVSLYYGCC